MAHVFRPTYTTPIPPKAAVQAAPDGSLVACWTDRHGRKVRAPVAECGTRCRRESSTWWVEYTDAAGNPQRVRSGKDKEAAKILAAELARQVIRAKSGLDAPPAPGGKDLTLSQLADRYRDHLDDLGRDPHHTRQTRRRLAELLAGLAAAGLRPHQAAGRDAAGWLSAEARRRGWAGATRKLYRATARAFGRWLAAAPRRLPDPFADLPPAGRADPTFERRALAPAEFGSLLAATRAGPPRCGIPGPDRAVLYLLAAYTGYRIGELAALTPEWFVGAPPRGVRLPARDSKRRQDEHQPLPAVVRGEIGAWLASRATGRPLWDGWSDWPTRGARMLRADLEAAGLPYRDAAGRVADFHSLRSVYITNLARVGVGLAAAQKLARHSTPVLTSNVYSKLQSELAGEADRLGDLPRLGSGLGSSFADPGAEGSDTRDGRTPARKEKAPES